MIVQCGTNEGDSTMLAQLPPLSVDSMTQVQLTEIIPQLVQLSTGRQHPLFGKSQYKPDWWPEAIPWTKPQLDNTVHEEGQTELLRQVVRCCYKHLGQENLLSAEELPLVCAMNENIMSAETQGRKECEAKVQRSSREVINSPSEFKNIMVNTATESVMDTSPDLDIKNASESLGEHTAEPDIEHAVELDNEKGKELFTDNDAEDSVRDILNTLIEQASGSRCPSENVGGVACENVVDSNESKPNILVESAKEAVVESPIWICFICAKQFNQQDSLMIHQNECEKEMEIIESKKRIEALQQEKDRLKVMKKKQIALRNMRIRPFYYAQRRKPRKLQEDPHILPPKSDYIQCLNLRERPNIEKESISDKKEIDSDCEIIDIQDDATPMTPRTPKSLMSQLSRDSEAHHGRRRHLSFSGIVSDSDSGEENTETSPKTPTPAISSLLFAIDISSALGQRLKKHLKIDNSIPVLKNFEKFCKGPEKNVFIEKLRQSDRSYPVVYKKRKKFSTKFIHSYKFSPSQRKEFMITKRTGLTKRSRRLLGLMKDFSVKLQRLQPQVIKEWTRRKPKPILFSGRPWNCPSNLADPRLRHILNKPVYGPKSARIKQINSNIRKLKATPGFNSSYPYNMVTKRVMNPNGTETMKIVYLPKSVANSPTSSYEFGGPMSQGLNRRKQTFARQRIKTSDDDDVQIIELSDSSDEEKDSLKSSMFCNVCTPKTKCPKHVVHFQSWQMPQPRPGLVRPVTVGQNRPNTLSRNSPHITSGHLKPLTGTITNTGIRYDNLSSHNLNGARLHITPPGATSVREMFEKPRPSMTASRNIQFGFSQPGMGGIQISNVQSLSQRNQKTPINSAQRMMAPGVPQPNSKMIPLQGPNGQIQYIRQKESLPLKPGMNPNILRKTPMPLLQRKPISNKPQEAIVIDDDDSD